MDEIKFALKVLCVSVAVVMAMQIKVGNETVEDYAEGWIRTSTIPQYLQKVADGGTMVIRNAAHGISTYANQALGNSDSSQKASRLNFSGFNRSTAAMAPARATTRTVHIESEKDADQE